MMSTCNEQGLRFHDKQIIVPTHVPNKGLKKKKTHCLNIQ